MFTDLTLTWKGEQKVVRSARMLRAIATVEEHIQVTTLASFSDPKKISFGRIAEAYAALLRFAGFSVDDGEVYAHIMTVGEGGVQAQEVITQLLMVLVPQSVMNAVSEKEVEGNEDRATKSKLSKSATKRSSRASN